MAEKTQLRVDDLVTFDDERRSYTVQAISSDGRWIVCTKPYPLRDSVLYTVLDTQDGVRGVDNFWGIGYETREQCEQACQRFEHGEARHSRRHPPIPYRIVKVRTQTAAPQ